MTEPSDKQIFDFFKAVFATYDKNGDGTIDTRELGTVLQALGRVTTDEKLAELIEAFDTDKNGKIDWTNGEFLLVVAAIDVVDVNLIDDLVFSAAFRTFDQVWWSIDKKVKSNRIMITGCKWNHNTSGNAYCSRAISPNGPERTRRVCG